MEQTQQTTIGIISTGRFATVLRALFSRDERWIIRQSSTSKPADHVRIFPLAEVLASDIIFLSIPIRAMSTFLDTHTALIKRDALVVSVCSVMSQPTEWMQTRLPASVDILTTHPLFGPDSTNGGRVFESLPMVISQIRTQDQERLHALLQFFRQEKITLHTISPSLHDQEMARSQAIAFLFGTIGMRLGLDTGMFDTKGTRLLLENQAIVSNDTSQLFEDMFHFNPFARKMLEKTIVELTRVRKELFHD